MNSSGQLDLSGGGTKVLAVASGGGHWVQLLRVMPALQGCSMTFVTVNRAYQSDVPAQRVRFVNDATRWDKLGLCKMLARITWILLSERPDVVVSTGAAPGYFALRIGKWLGARTIWLDSIANVEELSMAGRKVGRHADLWLTQWPHLARPDGPHFMGAVL
jgi:hypothetical protein